MIIHLKNTVEADRAATIASELKASYFQNGEKYVLVNSSKVKDINGQFEDEIIETFAFDTDIQLASRDYIAETRSVKIGDITIGGNSGNTHVIAGPCSVENKAQITNSAELLKSLGLSTLRGGCFKPRTSPYTFQGLGLEGLQLLAEVRQQYGLNIITEVKDSTHIEEVIEYSDVIQIGAKAMYDQGILKRCGTAGKPVLLKRGFGTNLQEFVQAAEFILSGGNDQVILCERGIRTFENKTRFTLDLCGVAYLKAHTNLPVVLDPSHAMGYAYGVSDLAKACVAMGVDGLLIEVHPEPETALSDAAQQLDHDTFAQLLQQLKPVAKSVGRTIV
jgi:3-deoxy-7-phosphoheptulonate synthase